MDKAKAHSFTVGTKVRLTSKFLRSTGQYTGRAPQSKWTVRACECKSCGTNRFICTDEPHDAAYVAATWAPEEVAANPEVAWRHINVANVERVR